MFFDFVGSPDPSQLQKESEKFVTLFFVALSFFLWLLVLFFIHYVFAIYLFLYDYRVLGKMRNPSKSDKTYLANGVRNNRPYAQKYTFTYDKKLTVVSPNSNDNVVSFTLGPQATKLMVAEYKDANTRFSWRFISLKLGGV